MLSGLAQSSLAVGMAGVLGAMTRTRVDLVLSSLDLACAAFAIRWTLHGLNFELREQPEVARGCYSHAFAIVVVGSLALASRLLLMAARM